ncbi:thrombomodulin-like [Cololabis saira]|uniref:thrombomodulin-like n=1 Tax=Cololabis saira TaxID=129043 RepID=UPI002AD5A55E|nr:thrombomodulin-like [Cololabis saira]
MIRAATTLLFCALLVRAAEEAAALRGRCAGGLCAFQHRLNLQAADKFCTDKTGSLLERGPGDELPELAALLSPLGGRFWLRSGSESCAAASVRGQNVTVESVPCTEALDGFVCQYEPADMCGPVQGGAGAQVGYIFSEDFEMTNSEALPPGTVATAQDAAAGGKYPSSKHICFGATWLAAPWFCEVLRGGCERDCDPAARACACPAGSAVHANNVSCVMEEDPCAGCAQGCQTQTHGGGFACTCDQGYRLAPDARGCVDVDECAEKPDACANEGEECVNVRGGYECRCAHGFDGEDGVCVNVSICFLCEHTCVKIDGVHRCACMEGFAVSPADPTRCVMSCGRECAAMCHPDPQKEEWDMQQCFCPDGYVTDISNKTATCVDIDECEHQSMCDHVCENLFGGYRCSCHDGYALRGGGRCVPEEDDGGDAEVGSGDPTERPTPASSQPASFPPYVRTGSVLGLTAFVALLLALLACTVRWMLRRCSTFKLHSFKHSDLDIFNLQQVTTETYKRLSFDKPSKNGVQRLSTLQETQTGAT